MCAIGPPNDVNPKRKNIRKTFRIAAGVRRGSLVPLREPRSDSRPSCARSDSGIRMDMLSELTVYANGRFARYEDAKVGLLTHGLNYGTGCFEGVRGFWSEKDEELYLLHVRDHYERLAQSAKLLMITLPHSVDELTEITVDLVARNEFRGDIYIRPIAYKSVS